MDYQNQCQTSNQIFHYTRCIKPKRVQSKGGVEGTRLEAKAKAKDTKKSEAKAKGSPSEDRPSRFKGQKCSRPKPRTKDTGGKCSPKKRSLNNFFRQSAKRNGKKGLQNFFFRRSPEEKYQKGLRKFSAIFLAFFNKNLRVQKILLSSSGGQGNFEASRTWLLRPRTSKCVLEDVVEAKDILEDSTSGKKFAGLIFTL